MKKIATIVTVIGSSFPALAGGMTGVVAHHELACATTSSYDEAWDAIDAQDTKWLSQIPGCFELKPGAKVEIIDVNMFGPSKIRLMIPGGGRPIELYTNVRSITLDK